MSLQLKSIESNLLFWKCLHLEILSEDKDMKLLLKRIQSKSFNFFFGRPTPPNIPENTCKKRSCTRFYNLSSLVNYECFRSGKLTHIYGLIGWCSKSVRPAFAVSNWKKCPICWSGMTRRRLCRLERRCLALILGLGFPEMSFNRAQLAWTVLWNRSKDANKSVPGN